MTLKVCGESFAVLRSPLGDARIAPRRLSARNTRYEGLCTLSKEPMVKDWLVARVLFPVVAIPDSLQKSPCADALK